jgi:hypothetical protein
MKGGEKKMKKILWGPALARLWWRGWTLGLLIGLILGRWGDEVGQVINLAVLLVGTLIIMVLPRR